MKTHHIVQITADNTNVFNATKGEEVPPWAKVGRIQLVASDSDWTYDLFVNGMEIARDCGPSISAADNAQAPDWLKPHHMFDVQRRPGQQQEVLMDINVVTAGVGLAIIEWEG